MTATAHTKRRRTSGACLGGACLLLGLLLFGCNIGKSGEYVALVSGEKIYLEEYNSRFNTRLELLKKTSDLGEEQIGKLRREFLDEMIDEKIMFRRAREVNIDVSGKELRKRIEEIQSDYGKDGFNKVFKEKDDYQAWQEELEKRMVLEKLIEREVNSAVSVSDEEALAYFKSHPTGWTAGESVHVSQIVLPSRNKAEETLSRLKNGEDFGTLAKEVSTGPEGAKGGDLGSFTKGTLPEHFDRALFSLQPGKFSQIVETPYGFHIFKVLEKSSKQHPGYDDVKEKIKEILKREKEEKEYITWLAKLRSGASITVNEPVLAKIGAVQNQNDMNRGLK